MKKFLTLFLTFALLISFSACGKNKSNQKPDNQNPANSQTDFVKPENYVTVVKLTINPEFNLYLDKDNNVLAVEALNDDAKQVKEKLTDTQKNISVFVKDMIAATNDAGFVKENAYIKVTITEVKDKAINTDAILSDAKTAITEKTTELKVTVTVETKVDVEEQTNKNDETTSKQDPTTPTASVYRLFMTDTFKRDGSIDFNVIATECIQGFTNEKYLKSEIDGIEFNYEFPEDVIYKRVAATFQITDKIWTDFKAKGSYNLDGPEKATFQNGKFTYTRYDSWGGGADTSYSIFNFYDNKKDTIEITYTVTPEDATSYRMRVVYKYDTKYAGAKYEFIKPNDTYYVGAISSTNKAFIDSIRIAKIIESPIKNLTYDSIMFYLYQSDPTHLDCYGFGGEIPQFDCACGNMDNINGQKWGYNPTNQQATCPCGNTVLKNPLVGEVHW